MVTVFHRITFENFEYDCQESAGPTDAKYKPTSTVNLEITQDLYRRMSEL